MAIDTNTKEFDQTEYSEEKKEKEKEKKTCLHLWISQEAHENLIMAQNMCSINAKKRLNQTDTLELILKDYVNALKKERMI